MTYVLQIFSAIMGDIPHLAWRPEPRRAYVVCLPILRQSSMYNLFLAFLMSPKCFASFTSVISLLSTLTFGHSSLFAIFTISDFAGLMVTKSLPILYYTISSNAWSSWPLHPSRAISSTHVGDDTLMFPICAPSPDACTAFNIVLLYLLYNTGCRIPCSNGILSVSLLFHFTCTDMSLYIFLSKVHKSPVTPSW